MHILLQTLLFYTGITVRAPITKSHTAAHSSTKASEYNLTPATSWEIERIASAVPSILAYYYTGP
jgi:hypothetical protein